MIKLERKKKKIMTMFDCTLTLINQFIECIPMLIALWLIFDFVGSFFFGKR